MTLERALVALQLGGALCVDGISLSSLRMPSEPLGEARWPTTAESSPNALPRGCDAEVLLKRHQAWTHDRTESHDCMSLTSNPPEMHSTSRALQSCSAKFACTAPSRCLNARPFDQCLSASEPDPLPKQIRSGLACTSVPVVFRFSCHLSG